MVTLASGWAHLRGRSVMPRGGGASSNHRSLTPRLSPQRLRILDHPPTRVMTTKDVDARHKAGRAKSDYSIRCYFVKSDRRVQGPL